ncbi:MAG: OadG family protein [Clostridiales bacterium]|nr:OadG family protein [Clostridiales bacterium]
MSEHQGSCSPIFVWGGALCASGRADTYGRELDQERMGKMGFQEGLNVALFCMGMVFVLLASIYALIRLTSAAMARFQRTERKN